ncbi:ATP-binding protein [Ohtaekwangia koreensis]|uniref:Serine/threonine-protein kinase RsbW n=1 Tax=Ohtaekwangia koreensis TaxID=688867 RepID=A0A1T5LA90_9BACT|nr:ATP-binding protein [Ohtaekwangia koreensis]SKC72966.1 serine/threonine-protein kinase RsbW [Ohtaekwangia koreensis]
MNYTYKVGCSIENLKGVRDFIRTSLKNHGVADLQISEIVLAIDEMCSNLMIHAHHCNPDDLFELHILVDKNNPVVFEIVDDGTVFDINQFHEPAIDNIVHQKRKGGLGIRLVKSIMDKVEYQNRSGRNVCRLIKSVHYQ